jgi:PAS domain S-box-containing protein
MLQDASQLIRELPDAVVVLTESGHVAQWSGAAARIYGFSADEAQGRAFEQLVVPANEADGHRNFLHSVSLGQTRSYESLRRRADGSLLYVDVSVRRMNGSAPAHWLLVEKDVTEIKAQRDGQLMEARFRDLLESTPDGIVMANLTGHIVIANSQAERLFGYGPGELRGRSVDVLLPQRYRSAHVGHRSGYHAQPRKRSMGSGLDLAGLRKDGSEFPVDISLSPLHTDDGTFVMSAIRDISERKEFEKTLQRTNQELADANAAKNRFLASMSHELRTPLNAIIGFTGTLLMRLPGPLTDDQEKQLRTVQGAGRHLLALINDLLDVAKIDAGKVELQWEEVDLRTVVDEVCATLKPQAMAKGLALEWSCEAASALVRTDRRTLRQILINLASNGIKFTHAGHVRMAIGRDTPVPGLSRAWIAIEDTGIGIDAEAQTRLFGAFSRVGRANHDTEGTGLGLHLSQKLAHLLGGSIQVESAPDRGSRFTLELPGG